MTESCEQVVSSCVDGDRSQLVHSQACLLQDTGIIQHLQTLARASAATDVWQPGQALTEQQHSPVSQCHCKA